MHEFKRLKGDAHRRLLVGGIRLRVA